MSLSTFLGYGVFYKACDNEEKQKCKTRIFFTPYNNHLNPPSGELKKDTKQIQRELINKRKILNGYFCKCFRIVFHSSFHVLIDVLHSNFFGDLSLRVQIKRIGGEQPNACTFLFGALLSLLAKYLVEVTIIMCSFFENTIDHLTGWLPLVRIKFLHHCEFQWEFKFLLNPFSFAQTKISFP